MSWTIVTPAQTPGWGAVGDTQTPGWADATQGMVRLMLENGDGILLESGGNLLAEGLVSDWAAAGSTQTPGWSTVSTAQTPGWA